MEGGRWREEGDRKREKVGDGRTRKKDVGWKRGGRKGGNGGSKWEEEGRRRVEERVEGREKRE